MYYGAVFAYIDTALKSHKRAIAEIKSDRQRVEKAKQESDKLKEKLKQSQARLAAEKERLRRSQEKLESWAHLPMLLTRGLCE